MTIATAFQPARGQNQKITATTTSAPYVIGKGNKSLRLLNVGANVIFVRTFNSVTESGTTATAGDTPLGIAGSPGAMLVIEKPQDHDSLACLAETASTIFHAQPGEGGA